MDVHPTKNGTNRYWSIPILSFLFAHQKGAPARRYRRRSRVPRPDHSARPPRRKPSCLATSGKLETKFIWNGDENHRANWQKIGIWKNNGIFQSTIKNWDFKKGLIVDLIHRANWQIYARYISTWCVSWLVVGYILIEMLSTSEANKTKTKTWKQEKRA